MAAPPKISMQLIDSMCELVAKGNYLDVACRYHGIDKHTFYQWCKRGRKERSECQDTLYSRLVIDLDKAVTKCETGWLGQLNTLCESAESLSVQADLIKFRMGRRFPKRWGRTVQRVEHDIAPPMEDGAEEMRSILEDATIRDAIVRASHRIATLENDSREPGDPPEPGEVDS